MTSTAAPTRSDMRVPVLMYHSISDKSTASFRPYTVSPRLFASHVAYLVDSGFTCLTVSELAELRGTGTPPPSRSVAITFDDAFRDVFTNAVTVLTAAGLRATMFVPTGFVGGSSRWLVAEGEDRRELLSWGELRQLQGLGIECGAHSHSHPQLDLLSRREVAREVALSKSLLEDQLQVAVTAFAYPFGYSSPAVRELVASLGFTSGYRVADLVSRPDDDRFAVPRLTVTCDTSTELLAEMLVAPRTKVDEVTSWSRSRASLALRGVRLKKRANAPGAAPAAPTQPPPGSA